MRIGRSLPRRAGCALLVVLVSAAVGSGRASAAAPLLGQPGIELAAPGLAAPLGAPAASTCDPADLPGGAEGPDNDGDECGFTVTGLIPVQDSKPSVRDTGSPALAKQCRTLVGQAKFVAYKSVGVTVADGMLALGAPDGAVLLAHFLGPIGGGGDGSSFDFSSGSGLAAKVKASPEFKTLANKVEAEITRQLADGNLQIDVNSVVKNLNFNRSKDRDLYYAFGGTQGLDISGSGEPVAGGGYKGLITYIVRDIYGFSTLDKFFGVGREMHYLQSVCGSPDFSQGAHWFGDSVTVTIPYPM